MSKSKGENYNANKVHDLVTRVLKELSLPADQIQTLKAESEKELQLRLSTRVRNAERLKIEIKELETKIDQLEEKFITGKIEEITFQKFKSKWQRDLAGKRIELEQLSSDERQYWELFFKNLEKLSSLQEIYSAASLENKKRILREVFSNGLFITKQGYRTPEINPLLYRNN